MDNSLFIPAPFFLLRSPRWSIEDWNRIIQAEDWTQAIFHLYDQDPLLQEAIAIASPSLDAALQKKEGKRTKELATSLFNYALRMASRSIPFGLFSFVANGSWGEKTEVVLDLNKVSQRARPDMEWVDSLLSKLYADESAFRALSVRTNPLITSNDERFFLSFVREKEKEDKEKPKTFSIRANPLTKAALRLAKEVVGVTTLCEQLLQDLEGLEKERVFGVLRALFAQQFLVPAISPSLLSLSPFDDLLPHLPPQMNPIALTKQNMEPLAEATMYLQVDSVYKGPPLTLNKNVVEELQSAANLLWKISPKKSLPPHIQAYHEKFIEKYGTHRTVPLLEMLDKEKGIGSFESDVRMAKPLSGFSFQWDKWLHQQWQSSLREKGEEIVITDQTVDLLFSQSKELPSHPSDAFLSMDLFCKVIADSTEQIDEGHFQLLFVQPTWQGGSSVGRFVDLFDEHFETMFRQYIKEEEALEKESIFVELSFLPKTARSANVAINPCFRQVRLDTQASGSDSLSLQDIYVGTTSERFYLCLKEGGSEVLARVGNLLNPTLAPLPFQFMREVSLAKYQLLNPFSWGALKSAAVFLPRVRYKKTILSLAQWNVDASFFRKESKEQIKVKFTAFAKQWNLPKQCLLIRNDQQLLIDREHPAHLEEIAAKLKKGESLQFAEHIPQNWAKSERGSQLCEIVVPFLKNPLYATKTPLTIRPYKNVSSRDRFKHLGSEWIYLKIYLQEEGTDRFLIQHISPICEKLIEENVIAGWFFIRYADPERHIRLRVKLAHMTELGSVISSLNNAASQWMEAGLIREMQHCTYEREVERYGGSLIDAAEMIFCADAASVIHLLTNNRQKLPSPVFYALSAIHFLQGFGLQAEQMIQILNLEKTDELEGFREHKSHLIEQLSSLDSNELFAEAFSLRKAAVAYFQSQIDLPQKELFAIYSSLLHMHCNRLGCDRTQERKAYLYARQTLIIFSNRHAARALCTEKT